MANAFLPEDMTPPAPLIENGPIRVKPVRHGLMAFSVNDTFIGRSLDLYGEWSPDDARVLQRFLRPGMTVLDIGANIGTHTLFLAQAVGPSGRVVAFEPVRALFHLLCGNLALNNLSNVEAIPTAVGRECGRAGAPRIDLGATGNFGAAALTADGIKDNVPVTTVDALDLDRCHLIKADVEGMESDVISGAVHTVRRHSPILFLENEVPEQSPRLLEKLAEFGYRMFWHSPALFSADNFFNNPVDVFPGLGSLNILCMPPGDDRTVEGLIPVEGPSDWPAWWPDWSAR